MLLLKLLKGKEGGPKRDVLFGNHWEFPKKMVWVCENLALEGMKKEHSEEGVVEGCSWYMVGLIFGWMLDC